MIKIMHIITTLGPAGAENMLCGLVAGMDTARFHNEIVTLTGILDLADRMHAIGVRVRSLHMKRSLPNPMLVLRLAQWIRRSKPDVIHTWMYHANLVGALASRLAGHIPVVWGIHNGALDPDIDRRRTAFVNRICARLSATLPARILCCSEASLLVHAESGYSAEKLELIPNGFDLEKTRPDANARLDVRRELRIPENSPIIGIASRFHPLKDHRNFIQAASRLHQEVPNARFLLFGLGVSSENTQLMQWIDAAGIHECCHLLGLRDDVPRLFAAMDIATNTSRREAFPVAVGEAMACGVPCVVTDAGDAALIVGDTGEVVSPADPEALAQAWRKLLEAGPDTRRRMGTAARNRIKQHFALPDIIGRYQEVYAQLATGKLRTVLPRPISQCAE